LSGQLCATQFEHVFRKWLDLVFSADVPDDVVAYSFNLFECADESNGKFGIEFVGAGSFDPDNEDWACDQVWSPQQRAISIPIEYSGVSWEECLDNMKQLIQKLLDESSDITGKLKRKAGIGLGFVDGDLELLWQKA